MGFDPKAHEKVEFWRDVRRGALTDGEPCPRDIDIFINRGTVLKNRLHALRKTLLKRTFVPLLCAGAVITASAWLVWAQISGIELIPRGSVGVAENDSEWPELANKALGKVYGVGLAGQYTLPAISKVIPGWGSQGLSKENVERVLSAPAEQQAQIAKDCQDSINAGVNCSIAGLIAYRHNVNREPVESISADPQTQLNNFKDLYLQLTGKCENYKKNGFFTRQKNGDSSSSFADVVFAAALDESTAGQQVAQIEKAWADDTFPKSISQAVKVGSMRELFEHRAADSCNPIPVAVYRINGDTLEYLVSIISRNGSSVSTTLIGLAESKGYRVTRLIKCRECSIVSNQLTAVDLFTVPETAKELAKEIKNAGYEVEGI